MHAVNALASPNGSRRDSNAALANGASPQLETAAPRHRTRSHPCRFSRDRLEAGRRPDLRQSVPVSSVIASPPAAHTAPPPPDEIARRLAPLCRAHGITRLEIFGSVARGDAQPGSDVDLIATFTKPVGWNIVSIEEEMASALGVPIDLLMRETVDEMTNPFRKVSIARDRRTIYAG